MLPNLDFMITQSYLSMKDLSIVELKIKLFYNFLYNKY